MNCESLLRSEFTNNTNQKIRNAYDIDVDSKLGTYLQVNPNLKSPKYGTRTFEIERIHTTRFRNGSNNLLIETGRFSKPRIPRENRICICGEDVQTLRHVLMSCPIITYHVPATFTSVAEYCEWEDLHDYLIHVSKMLKIEL